MAETVTRLALEGGKIEADAEFRKATGEIFTGHIMINCTDPKNPFTKSIVTISDLSSRLQAEHERIQNEKLLSVLELAGAVCHELNQPLMAISGYAELLMMNLDATHPHHGKLSKIIEQIKKTGDITRRLMSITKYDLVKHPDNPNLLDLKALKIPDLKS
jgi:signal transduction histidine kinase